MHRNTLLPQGQSFPTGRILADSWRGVAIEGAMRREDSEGERIGEMIGHFWMAMGEGID
jgi:hypothetical protein